MSVRVLHHSHPAGVQSFCQTFIQALEIKVGLISNDVDMQRQLFTKIYAELDIYHY